MTKKLMCGYFKSLIPDWNEAVDSGPVMADVKVEDEDKVDVGVDVDEIDDDLLSDDLGNIDVFTLNCVLELVLVVNNDMSRVLDVDIDGTLDGARVSRGDVIIVVDIVKDDTPDVSNVIEDVLADDIHGDVDGNEVFEVDDAINDALAVIKLVGEGGLAVADCLGDEMEEMLDVEAGMLGVTIVADKIPVSEGAELDAEGKELDVDGITDVGEKELDAGDRVLEVVDVEVNVEYEVLDVEGGILDVDELVSIEVLGGDLLDNAKIKI